MQIDLNADLGEGFGVWRLGDDERLLDVVTSANIACGFHAGDSATMARVCASAARRGVAIGAQVGYRDLAGFGRRYIDVPAAELQADVVYQLGALQAFAQVAGSRVRYVKPHGALYTTATVDPVQAGAIAAAVAAYDTTLPLLGQPGGQLARAADASGLAFVAEAFADRAYQPDGQLVPRSQPGALLADPGVVLAQALGIVTAGQVRTLDGGGVAVAAESLCLHGDTPGAVDLALAVRAALEQAGVNIAPFAG